MKKLFVVVSLVVAPVLALATCTWTQTSPTEGKVVCTTVGETALAGAASSTLGWQFACPKGVSVTACTDSGQALTAAATLSFFVWDPTAALWAKAPDFNITTATITATERCQTFAGLWTVVQGGRIAVLPTAGTLDGGGFTIWFHCN